jgi:ParB family chromosome partitioning protein
MATSIRELSKGKRDIWQLDPRILREKAEWNCRHDRPELIEHIEMLAQSILKRGFLADKPIVVYQEDGEFFVADGHCRRLGVLRAIALGADVESVPVVTEARGANEADRVSGMLTRNSGLPLTQLEQGEIYKRLMAFGWDETRIAETSGRSVTHVKQIFDLMEADPAAHAAIVRGAVGASTVAQAVRKHGVVKASKAIAVAVQEAKVNGKSKATARDVEQVATNGKARLSRSEIVDFFRDVVKEDNAPACVLRMAKPILAWMEGEIADEKLVKQLAEACK